MTLKKILQKKGYHPQKLKVNKVGHLYLTALINGSKARFILDTGASRTVLDSASQEKFNLKTKSSDVTATGVGKTGMELHLATIKKLSFKGFTLKNYEVALLNLEHVNHSLKETGSKSVDGVIGMDILVRNDALLQLKDPMVFWKPVSKSKKKSKKK